MQCVKWFAWKTAPMKFQRFKELHEGQIEDSVLFLACIWCLPWPKWYTPILKLPWHDIAHLCRKVRQCQLKTKYEEWKWNTAGRNLGKRERSGEQTFQKMLEREQSVEREAGEWSESGCHKNRLECWAANLHLHSVHMIWPLLVFIRNKKWYDWNIHTV